jgi:hypothetical protein
MTLTAQRSIMQTGSFNAQELKNYISMATTGHFPLFDTHWLSSPTQSSRKMSFRKANKNVKDVFTKLARHKSSDRKKMAIGLLSEEDRTLFVQSFMKLVECEILENTRTLQ